MVHSSGLSTLIGSRSPVSRFSLRRPLLFDEGELDLVLLSSGSNSFELGSEQSGFRQRLILKREWGEVDFRLAERI